MDWKAAWEKVKEEAGKNPLYSELYALMAKLEPVKFYFLMKDTNEKENPWFVVYAEKSEDKWFVDLCKQGWSPVPVRYKTAEKAKAKWPCITDERCIMTTSGCPTKESLVSFAEKALGYFNELTNKESTSESEGK